MLETFDVIVIGGGQSGLATGYYLRRTGLTFMIIDDQHEGGGAWLHTWKSLRLFSPAQWSSLPGMMMTGGSDYYPTRDVVIEYLKYYEAKYNLPVRRAEKVLAVNRHDGGFRVTTSNTDYYAKAVVSATGTFNQPYVPDIKGREKFEGLVIHSSQYQSPEQFAGKRVAVVGEGNSGAQILAEVSRATGTLWITQKEPRFLPDYIDGRYLFDAATQLYEAQKSGKPFKPPSLGDIVMVDAVKEARTRKILRSIRPFDSFITDGLLWDDGREEKIDVVIFCTGFRLSLPHLSPLEAFNAEGKIATDGTRSKAVDGLWLVGYGNWTGFASATLIGVGRSAKKTVEEIQAFVSHAVEK